MSLVRLTEVPSVLCGLIFLAVVITIVCIEITANNNQMEDEVSSSTEMTLNATITTTTNKPIINNLTTITTINLSNTTTIVTDLETTAVMTTTMTNNEAPTRDSTEGDYDYFYSSSSLTYS